jgi:hypothetical protein
MPRPAKRRQVETAASPSIAAYTRVSKANLPAAHDVKKAIAVELGSSNTPSKKRKASAVRDPEEHHPRLTRRTVSFAPSGSEDEEEGSVSAKRTCRRNQEPRLSVAQPEASVAVTVKGKRTAKVTHVRTAGNAHKPSSTTVITKTRTSTKKSIQTTLDATLRKAAPKKQNDLPPALLELVQLHKAFVKTVLVHITHNNANAPADFTAIEPDISRNWGKRKVTVEDIQRCLAIQSPKEEKDSCPFVVCDYGRGKVCIELAPTHVGRPIHEEKLYKQFEANLRHFCTEQVKNEDEMDVDISFEKLSLDSLPKVAITTIDTGIRSNPVLVKGQRALTAFKNDIAAREHEKQAKQTAAANNPMLNPDGTKMSLLDRLRLKQLARESGPLPPSGPELDRRAALNRVMDVSATVSLLSLASPMARHSLPLPTLLQRLKDSMRVPISDDEAARCVRLIAAEVAPEWLKVVAFGGRDNVVVQKNLQPVDRVLQERVTRLIGQ